MRPFPLPVSGGKVQAIGPTNVADNFVVLVKGSGFKYLRLVAPDVVDEVGAAEWIDAAEHPGEEVAGAFGLHFHAQAEGSPAVSFLDGSRKKWCCQALPKVPSAEEPPEVAPSSVSTLDFPSPAIAVCSMPEDEVAFVLLQSGSMRFLNLRTGTSAGKSLKVEQPAEGSTHSLVPLGNGRVCLLRAEARGANFVVIGLDDKGVPSPLMNGTLPTDDSFGSLLGACSASGSEEGEARVVQCYGGTVSEETKSHQLQYTYADVSCANPAASIVPGMAVERTGKTLQPSNCWASVGGFLLEWAYPNNKMDLTIRDLKQGLLLAHERLPFAGKVKECPFFAFTTQAGIFVSSTGDVVGILWSLDGFCTHAAVGVGMKKHAREEEPPESLAPLLQVLKRGKRKRKEEAPGASEDPLAATFATSKKTMTVDENLARALLARIWQPSHDLVDHIIERGLWRSAVAITTLADADNAFLARLLAANTGLLVHVVRSCRTSLRTALRDYLPQTAVATIVEDLILWLTNYAVRAEEELLCFCPDLPTQIEVLSFVGELVAGCAPALLLLPKGKLEEVSAATASMCRDYSRMEVLYGLLRGAWRARELSQPKRRQSATMEIWALPL